MFKNPFSFNGRIRRLEFGLTYVFSIAVISLYVLILKLTDSLYGPYVGFIALLIYIPLVWLSFAQGAKRCHDRGNSGWWLLIPFYSLWMFFGEGEVGDNEYGPNPKGVSYASGDSNGIVEQ